MDKAKVEELIRDLDHIVEEAPLDFLGAGDSTRFANQCEREWHTLIDKFKDKLRDLINKE